MPRGVRVVELRGANALLKPATTPFEIAMVAALIAHSLRPRHIHAFLLDSSNLGLVNVFVEELSDILRLPRTHAVDV